MQRLRRGLMTLPLLVFLLAVAWAAAPEPPPNILLIVSDDHGCSDLGRLRGA